MLTIAKLFEELFTPTLNVSSICLFMVERSVATYRNDKRRSKPQAVTPFPKWTLTSSRKSIILQCGNEKHPSSCCLVAKLPKHNNLRIVNTGENQWFLSYHQRPQQLWLFRFNCKSFCSCIIYNSLLQTLGPKIIYLQ